MKRLSVALLGTGALADLAVRRIKQRRDLDFIGALDECSQPPATTDVVLFLPHTGSLADGSAAARIAALLAAGFDVVSTAPTEALGGEDLLAACRSGGSTFHGSGGFQSSIPVRVNRAFASITRNIRSVELVEEIRVDDLPLHPWRAVDDAGFGAADPQAAANAVEGYYDAGLHALADAVFGDAHSADAITVSATRAPPDGSQPLPRAASRATAEHVIVQRTLGNNVAYDSVWTKQSGSDVPLRYRLRTSSADAVGNVTIDFHADMGGRPVDHLACTGLLDAIRPVFAAKPGVLRHDLDIWQVKPDDRFAR